MQPSDPATADVQNSELYYEIVKGQRVLLDQKPAEAILCAGLLAAELYQGLRPKSPGIVLYKPLIRFEEKEFRRPDLAYVTLKTLERDPFRARRMQKSWKGSKPLETSLIPNLAIEMISPTITFGFLSERTMRYLSAGVQLVWHIFYETKRIHVYDSPKRIKIFDEDDSIHGFDAFPEFSMTVGELLRTPNSAGK